MSAIREIWTELIGFTGSDQLPYILIPLLVLIFLPTILFRRDPERINALSRRRFIGWAFLPFTFYARNLTLRRWTANILGVLLIIWFTQSFTVWVQPALKPEDLFPPPFTGPQAVEVQLVDQGPVVKSATYTGTAQPIEFVQINARVDGYIEKLRVHEGDRVKAGDILAQLDTTNIRPKLDKARAEATFWEAEWKRAQELYEDAVISLSERDRIRKTYEGAKAHANHMRNQIQYAEIRAPLTGWVAQRKAYRGQYIRKGETIFRIDRLDGLRLRFNVSERDLPFIRSGDRVWLEYPQIPMLAFNRKVWREKIWPSSEERKIAALSGKLRPHASHHFGAEAVAGMLAKVAVIYPAVDPKTHTGTVEVRISNPGALLKSDTYVVGHFFVERVDHALRIPSRAIVQMAGGKSVIFVGPAFSDEGNAEMREIEIGLRTDEYTQVRSGIESNEFVIIRGQRALTDGQLVTVVARQGGP